MIVREEFEKLVKEFMLDSFKTISDAGGVRIASLDNSLTFVIPNGMGDGVTNVVISDSVSISEYFGMQYFGLLSGKFCILAYDGFSNWKKTEAVRELSGNYAVFYKDGCVVFEKARIGGRK